MGSGTDPGHPTPPGPLTMTPERKQGREPILGSGGVGIESNSGIAGRESTAAVGWVATLTPIGTGTLGRDPAYGD